MISPIRFFVAAADAAFMSARGLLAGRRIEADRVGSPAPFIEDGPTMRIGTTCEDLALVIDRPCTKSNQLEEVAERRISNMIGRPVDEELGLELESDLRLNPEESSFMIVVGLRRPDLARRVEVAAAEALLAPQISPVGNLRPQASALWGWIRLGIALAGSMFTLSVVISLGDRFVTAVKRHRILTLLGLDGQRLRRVEAAQTAVIYGRTVGVTGAVGSANAVLMARFAQGAHLPAGLVAASGALAALLGGVCLVLTDATTRASLRGRP